MLNTDDFTRAWLSKLYEFKIHDLEEPSNNMIKLGPGKHLNYDSKFHKIPFYKFFINNSHLFIFIRQSILDIKNGEINFFENSKKINTNNDKSIQNINHIPNQNLEVEYLEKASMLGKILLLRLKKISKSCGSELIVIYSGWWDYRGNHYDIPTLYFLNEAKSFFKKFDIEYYDFVKDMKNVHQNFNQYVIQNDWHPNEQGHKIISENIIKKISLD